MKKNVWIAGMTAILSAGLVWLAPVFTLADERIPDGVSVGAVSLSGLTEEEAEKQIESYVNEKLNQDHPSTATEELPLFLLPAFFMSTSSSLSSPAG